MEKNNFLDLEKEMHDINKWIDAEEKKAKCDNLLDKIYGWFKGLHYKGVEDWRVRCDFKYMNEHGYNDLMSLLIKEPIFEYSGEFSDSKNMDYWKFLVSKTNLNKLQDRVYSPRMNFT